MIFEEASRIKSLTDSPERCEQSMGGQASISAQQQQHANRLQ
jgi:hypothetical protein